MQVNFALVHEFFSYDPQEGLLRWKKNHHGAVAGAVAGKVINGARHVEVGGRSHAAHRLIWLYMTGEWPKPHVSHINGDRMDNRWANLKHVKPPGNPNLPKRGNSNGLAGVSRSGHKWRATLNLFGKNHHLGSFLTPGEAHAAYLEAKRLFTGE